MLALRRIRRPIGPRVKKRTPTRKVLNTTTPGRITSPSRPGRVTSPSRPGRVTNPSRPGRVRTPNPGRVGGKKKRVIDKFPVKKLTAKPQRVQQSSRMERVARGRVEAPSKTRRVQQSSAASTAQPRVRKRRKGPSYTVTSLNV